MIDLRSDTVTQPDEAMRLAIAQAAVGDDVFGDDPTVIELEEKTANLLGKEKALFVPSGTMANQLALRCQTQPGDEVLVEKGAHIYHYEAGASAALSGVICKLIDGERGVFTGDDLRAVVRGEDVHYAPSRLVCIENTHNSGGGRAWQLNEVRQVTEAARELGLSIHMDGARLWNASVATGSSVADYAACTDTVSVCFSKGLGAPVGSALAGDAKLIDRARRFRKQFGGGMRQAGMIAAGAIYALEHNRERLAMDHANAKRLADGLSELNGITIDVQAVETNLVYFDVGVDQADLVVSQLKQAGVLVCGNGKQTIRAVPNLMVSESDIDMTIEIIGRVIKGATNDTA